MFNVQDLKNLQVFLARVDLKGTESMAHAELLIKVANSIQALENPVPTAPPEEPPKTPPGKAGGTGDKKTN